MTDRWKVQQQQLSKVSDNPWWAFISTINQWAKIHKLLWGRGLKRYRNFFPLNGENVSSYLQDFKCDLKKKKVGLELEYLTVPYSDFWQSRSGSAWRSLSPAPAWDRGKRSQQLLPNPPARTSGGRSARAAQAEGGTLGALGSNAAPPPQPGRKGSGCGGDPGRARGTQTSPLFIPRAVFKQQQRNTTPSGPARLPPAAGRCRQRPIPIAAPQAAGPQAPPPPRAHPDAEAVGQQVVGDVQGPWAGAALRLGRLGARRPAGRLAEGAVGAEAGAQQRQGAECRVGAEAGPGEALQEQQRHRGALAAARPRPAALPQLNARPAAPPRGWASRPRWRKERDRARTPQPSSGRRVRPSPRALSHGRGGASTGPALPRAPPAPGTAAGAACGGNLRRLRESPNLQAGWQRRVHRDCRSSVLPKAPWNKN